MTEIERTEIAELFDEDFINMILANKNNSMLPSMVALECMKRVEQYVIKARIEEHQHNCELCIGFEKAINMGLKEPYPHHPCKRIAQLKKGLE